MPVQLVTFGSFAFDCGSGTLLRHGLSVAIGTRGRALLKALLEANGEVVTKSALMDAAWPCTNVEESNLTVQIAALRKVLGRAADGEEWIATVPRVGYRLVHSTPLRNREIDTSVDATVPRATGSTPSIAVMPFTNMSSDPEQEYFGDGLAEDLITDLSKVAGLLVIARHSSFVYKGKQADIRSIATDLSVRYVIEGSVRRAADRVRISAQIIDALDNRPLWAERFDRDLADIFALQDEIVARIVNSLSGLLPPMPSRAGQRPVNFQAYDLFMREQALANQSVKGYRPARLLIERSIELDPGFADNLRLRATEQAGHRAKATIRTIRREVEVWLVKRRLLGADDSMFKDVGVSSGNVDWLVRNGRGDRCG
ncbi:winged helix-turn-helix domain-containing protein [Mesorhizobium sp.]|uniref:winged helix-turn-helix domain-containing protein n=1 Tax=Mesorhizobium sp. TaxID=1871066 RepID=UPI0025D29D42|nr:winged helix-turn-helix domain-containing protein [Mesorhizobium sp.]